MNSELVEIAKELPEINSNNVFKEDNKNRTLYYLPCYVRFKVKEILSVDIEGLTASVAGTLLFSFSYGNLDRHIVDQFVGDGSKAILLLFSRQDSIELKEDKGITYKEEEHLQLVHFVVRQDFTCYLLGDVFFTPFEVLNLFLTVTVQSVVLDPKLNEGRRIDIKFNCMTNDKAELISYGEKTDHSLYSLATHYIGAKYSNHDKNPYKASLSEPDEVAAKKKNGAKINASDSLEEPLNTIEFEKSSNALDLKKKGEKGEKVKDSKIKNFQYAHFRIPLYKHPGVSLFEIFVPLWILGFINLLVFFQQNVFSSKLATIATVTLAFIAFIPTINQAIPNTPGIKIIDVMVYLQVLTSILTMIDSLITIKTQAVDYVFVWDTDGWFIASLVINLLVVVYVLLMFLIHKVCWQKSYVAAPLEQKKEKTLIKASWYNKECDELFSAPLSKGSIVLV